MTTTILPTLSIEDRARIVADELLVSTGDAATACRRAERYADELLRGAELESAAVHALAAHLLEGGQR